MERAQNGFSSRYRAQPWLLTFSMADTSWRNSPDSLKRTLNLVSCWVRTNYIDIVQHRLWRDLNYLGLLINSANVLHKVLSFLGKKKTLFVPVVYVEGREIWSFCARSAVQLTNCDRVFCLPPCEEPISDLPHVSDKVWTEAAAASHSYSLHLITSI